MTKRGGSRKVAFTGKVIDYRYELSKVMINGISRTWHLHTFYVFVEGEGVYHWTHRGEEKPQIEIGEVHTFQGIVAVEFVGRQ